MQGLLFRKDDSRFSSVVFAEAVEIALRDPNCFFVNRNRGSGTRVLIDQLLSGRRPPGYVVEANSHHSVAAAIRNGRADWGIAIEHAARIYDLGFLPWRTEAYDFVIPKAKWDDPPVRAFRALLDDPETIAALAEMGFPRRTGESEGDTE